MTFYIAGNDDKKIEININNKNVQKSKLLMDFYKENRTYCTLYMPFNCELVEGYCKKGFKFHNLDFELVYSFLNYINADFDDIYKYISYKLYILSIDESIHYIENIIDKKFLKLLLNQKRKINKCKYINTSIRVFIKIKLGADVNLPVIDGNTALQYFSTRYDCAKIIKLLLMKYGADVNIKNSDGKTALYLASYLGYLTNVKLLCEYGADVNIKNSDGKTALDCAYEKKYNSVINVLVNNCNYDIKK